MTKKTRRPIYIIFIAIFIFFVTIFAIILSRKTNFLHNNFTGYEFENIEPENSKVKYSYIKMANEKMEQNGILGDGCQWQTSLESSADGNLMLYGTDVAGMYRSTDHGKTWEMCNTGLYSRGANMFAIDPFNNKHFLVLGCNSSARVQNGIYITFDGGDTFSKVFTLKVCADRYMWDGLEFDSTSFDAKSGICTDVYFSTPYLRDATRRVNPTTSTTNKSGLTKEEAGLYHSSDGGNTFSLLNNSLSDGIVKFTENGNLYVGNQNALFLVNKQSGEIAQTFFQNNESDEILRMNKGITGLDVVKNTIYAQTWDGIFKFDDGANKEDAESSMIQSTNYPSQNWPQYVEVSGSNQNHIMIDYREDMTGSGWKNVGLVSFDGGITYQKSKCDTSTLFSIENYISREKLSIIDPSDDNNVLTFGTDTILRSYDGGKNFVQASGISNMMCGGKFNLNYYDTDLLMFGAQDYGGAISTNGGSTWQKLNITIDGVAQNSMYGGFARSEE